jgi:hypothetical protein
MSATVRQVAEELGMDPGDVLVLAWLYPDDDTWEEEGVLSTVAAYDLRRTLSPYGERHIPEYYLPR